MDAPTATCNPLDDLVTAAPLPLGEYFDRHHAALWRFALRLTGDPDRAHDAVQETFLRALKARLPAEPRAVEAWLMQTLVNYCRDRHRWHRVRRLHRERISREGPSVASTDPGAASQARWELDRAVRQLSVKRRAVLILSEIEGRSVAEIATAIGIREATVRWHLAAAKRTIRAALGAVKGRPT